MHALFVGLATLDVVQHVPQRPRPDGKVTATWQGLTAGGPALNAAVTAAALGAHSTLVSRVGDGPVADLVRADLARHGVDLLDVAGRAHSPAVSSIVIDARDGSRQVVSADATAVTDPLPRLPSAVDAAVDAADVVLLDGHHPDLVLPVARRAARRGIPRVLDAGRPKPVLDELVGLCSDVVCSADFRLEGRSGPDLLAEVLRRGADVGAVTDGAGAILWRTVEDSGSVRPPPAETVDTLGAGDVLHGAYAYARVANPAEGPAAWLDVAAGYASSSCTHPGTRAWLATLDLGGPLDPRNAPPAAGPTPERLRLGELAERARALADRPRPRGGRVLLGITGAPGAGKSTLGAALVAAVNAMSDAPRAVLVPMDGFHLSNAQLEAQGRRAVKGAAETFDDAGYAALLARLARRTPGEVVYAPGFDRALEEPIAGSIRIDAAVDMVVTEGNYLLAEHGHWPAARAHLEQVWFLDVDAPTRVHRLVDRHVAFGKSPDSARAWVERSDEANARLVVATAGRADLVVRLDDTA